MARVRTATEQDLDGVLAGYAWLFAPPGSTPPDWDEVVAADRLRRVLADPASTVFVALEGDTVIGLCTVYRELLSVRFGPRAWVEDLAVSPAHRSAGAGRALLHAALQWAREQGCSHLELDSGSARTDAHRFYEREGGDGGSRSFSWRL